MATARNSSSHCGTNPLSSFGASMPVVCGMVRQPEARDVRRDRVPHGEILPALVGTGFTGAEVGHLDQQPVVVPLVVDALLAVSDPALQFQDTKCGR